MIVISGIKLAFLVGIILEPHLSFFSSQESKEMPVHSSQRDLSCVRNIREVRKGVVSMGDQRAEAAETGNSSQLLPSSQDVLLARQWEKLREKQAELKRKERFLKELEKKIEEKLKEQRVLADRLQRLIEQADVLKDKKIKHLVSVYSHMDPARAARVLEKLDKNLAVKILAGMPGRTAGEILNNMDSKTAAKLSEALTRFQTPFGE